MSGGGSGGNGLLVLVLALWLASLTITVSDAGDKITRAIHDSSARCR